MSFSRPSIVLKLLFVKPFVEKIVIVLFVRVSEVKIWEKQPNTILFVFVDEICYFRSIELACYI